jgi:asparagine synthase (glutamine-hydrolysing)
MPGIVGLITKLPRVIAEPQVLRMVKSICHEAFYVSGVWVDETLGIYAGWAERRSSSGDGMPFRNETGTVHLLFSGEDFPNPAIWQELKAKGHDLGPHKSSYLPHAYEEDPRFPYSLNGRFQGLLADQSRGTAILFNDRYGLHRLYYHESKDGFYFATEAKAILAVRTELRDMDFRATGEFVACGCTLENRSLFKGIQVLPAGSAWVFRNGALEKKSNYFEPREWEEQSLLNPETYYQQLRDVFRQNLQRYFEGGEQIGMSLTGGLDSRMILAWRRPDPGSLPCYSFGGAFRDSQDVLLARRVASLFGQRHEILTVGDDFLSRFSHFAERTVYLTDGCVDVSHSPDLYVNELARQIAPVRMTGNYGGEVLRRVRAFKPVTPAPGLFRPEFLTQIHVAAKTYAEQVNVHPLSFAVFRQAPWHHYGLLSLEETQLSLRSPFLDNDFVRTVYRAPESACIDNEVCLRLIREGFPELVKLRTDRGLAGNAGKLWSDASRGFLEFTFKAEYAYDYGMPQWVAQADNLLSPLHLERLFLGRHKFKHFRFWYRNFLAKYVQEVLLDPRTLARSYVEPSTVETIVRGHTSGNRNYTTAIHKLLTLELIQRQLLDPQRIA